MKYIVTYSKTIWFETEVTATSKEQAISKAKHPSTLHSNVWVESKPEIEWVAIAVGEDK